MLLDIQVSLRIADQINRQVRSKGERIQIGDFIRQGIPLVEILASFLTLEKVNLADLSVEDGTLWIHPKED